MYCAVTCRVCRGSPFPGKGVGCPRAWPENVEEERRCFVGGGCGGKLVVVCVLQSCHLLSCYSTEHQAPVYLAGGGGGGGGQYC